MSFQEEKNINICENYYNFIKQLSEDYLKYITNYKIASIDYLKKISLNHEKYSSKLSEVDEELLSINSTHIISVTSIIPKVVEQQITGLNDFLKQIDEKIINFDKLIKVKNTEFIESVSSFKDIKNELHKKYKEIDKLKANYMANIELAEDAIHKYYMKQNTKKKTNSKLMLTLDKNTEFVSLEEQANNSIQKTKKLEEEYVKNISLVKTVEKSYIDISETSIKKSTKIVCEITSYLKELISDCLVFLNDSFKLPLVVIDTYLNEIVSLDEYTKFDDIIKSSYKNNIIFKQINPEKYTSKFFQQKNTSNNSNKTNNINIKNIINRRIKSNSMSKEDLQEMDFIQEEEKFLTVKKMLENFDLFESNKYNLDIEEEKLRCKYLTLKILSFAPKSKLYSNKITKISITEEEEFEEMLKKKQNRVIFIQQLSQFRTRGIFDIPEKEYKILSRLFNKIAKLVESEEDYDSVINIIILSQTYYKNKNNKKEYLHNAIMNNELFKSKKFWETFIKYSIDKEIEKCKQNDKKNSKENEANYGNIAFAQLMSMINNMIEFELDINIIEEIILPIIKQYKIDPESVEAIFAPINEKKKDIKNESKNQNIQIEEKEEKLDEKIEGQKREEQKIDSKKEDEKIRIKIEGIKKEEELENEKIKNEKEIKIEENAIEMNKTEEK
jgi:hypothetical protein